MDRKEVDWYRVQCTWERGCARAKERMDGPQGEEEIKERGSM